MYSPAVGPWEAAVSALISIHVTCPMRRAPMRHAMPLIPPGWCADSSASTPPSTPVSPPPARPAWPANSVVQPVEAPQSAARRSWRSSPTPRETDSAAQRPNWVPVDLPLDAGTTLPVKPRPTRHRQPTMLQAPCPCRATLQPPPAPLRAPAPARHATTTLADAWPAMRALHRRSAEQTPPRQVVLISLSLHLRPYPGASAV